MPPHSIKCDLCNSTNCEQENDVGFDIDEEGEEKQHIQRCLNCGAERFVSDFTSFNGKTKVFYGKWVKDSYGGLY